VQDVIVIGGGFAGLIAARELGRRGRSVTVLEARGRLGGRTWVASFAGVDVELGGTFIHWSQPHVWAEMTRYGLGVAKVPEPERSFALADGEAREVPPEAWFRQMEALDRLCEDAATLVPDPMRVPAGQEAEAADRASVQDRIDAVDLLPEERVMMESLGAGLASTTCDRCGYLWGFAKAYALGGYSAEGVFAANGAHVLEGGTGRLIQAIADDTPATIRLGETVAAIGQDDDHVTVATTGGEELVGRAVVAALPVNALAGVAFSPPLSPIKREAVATGLAGSGLKAIIKLAPGNGSISASAPASHPISFVESIAEAPDGGQIAVAFGPSAEDLPLTDHGAVAGAVEAMLPGARVEEVGGHDWAHDPFSRETWATYAPGTYLRWMPELARREGRVAFAGSDVALGWGGYIDGAIETGLRAAHEVSSLLGDDLHAAVRPL
jgi:monoamine oxidase